MGTFETVNGKVVTARVQPGREVLARRGAMLAYTGDVRFSPVHGGGGGGLGGGMAGMAGRMLAGEQVAMMVAQGSGTVHYGYRGLYVTVVELDGSGPLQVEASRLMAHDAGLQSAVVMIGQQGGLRGAVRNVASGMGLATTQLHGAGSVALLSHGGTFALPVDGGRTVVVDPQAYVAHVGHVQVDLSASVGWRDAVGRGSGEAMQLRLDRPGHRVRAGVRAEGLRPPMIPLNPTTLPDDDNVPGNSYAYCKRLDGQLFMQTGRMIAYYPAGGGPGIRFEPLSSASLGGMVAARFSAPLYTRDWVVANGSGHLVLGDRGYDINSYDIEDGNLTLRAANLLAFDPGLQLKQSIVPGFLTLVGTGKFLASSSGPVIFAEPPLRVDPQALVGWADCPSPSHHYDAGWMQGFLGGRAGPGGHAVRRGAPVRLHRRRDGAPAVLGAGGRRPAPGPPARGPGRAARHLRPAAGPADGRPAAGGTAAVGRRGRGPGYDRPAAGSPAAHEEDDLCRF